MASPDLDKPTRTLLEAALDTCFRTATSRRDVLRFLDAVQIPVIVTDAARGPSGPRILFVNAEMCRMCRYPRDALVGRSPRRLQGPETDTARANAFRRELETYGRASARP